VDLVEVRDKRLVRLEGVIAVAAVGVAAGIGSAAVVRLLEELRCAVGFTRGIVCRGGWCRSIAGAAVRGVALSVVEGKVGFEMVRALMAACVAVEVVLVMRGCALILPFDIEDATLKAASWGHVSVKGHEHWARTHLGVKQVPITLRESKGNGGSPVRDY